jgi:hypothetical protein
MYDTPVECKKQADGVEDLQFVRLAHIQYTVCICACSRCKLLHKYVPGGALAPAALTIACLSVGLCALPAF